MSTMDVPNWYLVRTKPHKERWVHDQLVGSSAEVFLPLLRTRRRQKIALSPLFPCYLFACLDIQRDYFTVKYTAGVNGLVSAGREPLAVPASIIEDLRQRGSDGAVELPQKSFDKGERVKVVSGPFRGFDAIFERYLSSSERVAILLEAIQTHGIRVVLPTEFVSESD
ncbi:MAG TPA: transcription termination/antitermination NusG family protein [Candidatus Binataceae bacterium]|nr:transcription termination/antitermination NusG family protein [Candidatus Binataceae bacterium]